MTPLQHEAMPPPMCSVVAACPAPAVALSFSAAEAAGSDGCEARHTPPTPPPFSFLPPMPHVDPNHMLLLLRSPWRIADNRACFPYLSSPRHSRHQVGCLRATCLPSCSCSSRGMMRCPQQLGLAQKYIVFAGFNWRLHRFGAAGTRWMFHFDVLRIECSSVSHLPSDVLCHS